MGRGKQQRSRQTFLRIVESTERLLKDRLFEDLTVQEIVDDANATVGSFYNLFDDKLALLPELYRRHCQEMTRRVDRITRRFASDNDGSGAPRDLARLIRGIVTQIVQLHQTHRGLLRALVLQAHLCPDVRVRERPPEMTDLLPRLARLVADCCDRPSRRQNLMSARVGLLMVLATVREVYLYPNTSAVSLGISRRGLVNQLTRCWLAYIRSHPVYENPYEFQGSR